MGEIKKEMDCMLKAKMLLLKSNTVCFMKGSRISEPTQPIQKEWHSVVETEKRQKDKAENSPKGWLHLQLRPISQQKAGFFPLSTNREHGRIILCLSASFLYPPFDFLFGRSSCSHTSLNSYMNK